MRVNFFGSKVFSTIIIFLSWAILFSPVIFILLFVAPGISSKAPPRLDINIRLDGTYEAFMKDAPIRLKDKRPNSNSKHFNLHNMDPHIIYKGKEVVFRDVSSIILTYECSQLVELVIYATEHGPKTTEEVTELFTYVVPAIDTFGFKRDLESKAFSLANLPFPEKYSPKNGNRIIWESEDEKEILKLSVVVPDNPEIYKDRRYYINFMYFNSVEFEYAPIINVKCPIQEK